MNRGVGRCVACQVDAYVDTGTGHVEADGSECYDAALPLPHSKKF